MQTTSQHHCPSSPDWKIHLLPPLLLKQHVFVGNQRFHHESLVTDVVQRCHGVQLGGPHQCRAEDDAQVLAGHEVVLLVLGHSSSGEDRKWNRA